MGAHDDFGPVEHTWRHLLQRIRCQTLVPARVQADDGDGGNAGEHSHHIHHRNIRSDHEAVVEEERPFLLPGGHREQNEQVAEAGHELHSSAAAVGVLHDNRVESVVRGIHEEEGGRDDMGESSRDHHRQHHRRQHAEDSDPVVRGWCRCCYLHWDPTKTDSNSDSSMMPLALLSMYRSAAFSLSSRTSSMSFFCLLRYSAISRL